jgi:hypothetical protein
MNGGESLFFFFFCTTFAFHHTNKGGADLVANANANKIFSGVLA